jgi:hypothetical protein
MTTRERIRRSYIDKVTLKQQKREGYIHLALFLIMGFIAITTLILAF